MKLKDIKVGGEYLASNSQDWHTQMFSTSAYWSNRRVRVVDATLQNWVYNPKTNAHEKAYGGSYMARKGILVQIVDPETGVDVPNGVMVATLASVRGPWAETSAQVIKNREEKDAYEARRKLAKTARQDVVSDALRLAEKLGVKAKSAKWDHDGDIEMTPAQLIKILTALEASGWSADGQ